MDMIADIIEVIVISLFATVALHLLWQLHSKNGR
jgi:hypothetical protein